MTGNLANAAAEASVAAIASRDGLPEAVTPEHFLEAGRRCLSCGASLEYSGCYKGPPPPSGLEALHLETQGGGLLRSKAARL